MKIIFLLLGAYYLITAVWPLVSIKSFEAVTGPKTDRWLVYTVSCFLIGPSLLYLYSGIQIEDPHPLVVFLALINCLALLIIDVTFVVKKVIWKTYLLDALAELIFIIAILIKGQIFV